MEKKYNETEMKILNRVYIDYKQLERRLDIDVGDTHDIEKCYEYMKNMAENNKTITFTNVDLDLGYFDFNYNDMLLTISTYNRREICKLSETIDIYFNDYLEPYEIEFEELEKIVIKLHKFCKISKCGVII